MVAASPIVDETDNPIPELAVQHLVRDMARHIARSGDQDALEPNSVSPPPLEGHADGGAGHVGEDGGQDEEQRPDHS